MSLWNNDEAIAFFNAHGYPTQYNDGLLQWLRDVYDLPYGTSIGGSTLPDLLKRYIDEFGDDFNMRVLSKSAAKISLVEPAATFTSTTPTSAAAGADTLLTSAGVHGLTSAVSVGASIYISGGTGWTVGFHTITAIAVDTTGVSIQIDTPFDAGFGTPTIALANTEVTLASISVPPMLENSVVEVDSTWGFTSSANSKTYRYRFTGVTSGSAVFSANVNTTGTQTNRSEIEFQNRNSTESAVMSFPISGSYGSNNTSTSSQTINTSTGVVLTLTAQPAVANEIMSLERYVVFFIL